MSRKVEFQNLEITNSRFSKELKEAADRVIDSGRYLRGRATQDFEKSLAESCGAKYCVGTDNGLGALRLIFRALIELGRLKKGDKVIVPGNTFIASFLPLTELGLRPLPIDPNPETMCIDAGGIAPFLSDEEKAILAVHLYGTPCRMKGLAELVKERGLLLIEDNAQAIGARAEAPGINGSALTGNLGHAAAFSFYPAKNIGALGDAGAVTTDDKELADTIRALANYGESSRYHNEYCGYNSRIDEIQAAMLCVKLYYLKYETAARRRVAALYDRLIDNQAVVKPLIDNDMVQVWHQYVVRLEDSVARDRFRRHLEENGIETLIHYPVPAHLQPCYKGLAEYPLPVTEDLAGRVVSLPIANLDDDDTRYVASVINTF